jgi:hypothetical protein
MELPKEAMTLDGFEAWDRRRRAPVHQEGREVFVSLRANSIIGISKAAHEMLGSPNAVQLLFDRKLRRIGMKPVDREAERVAHCPYYLLHGGQTIQCKVFLEHYGVPLEETTRYTPKLIDGVLVVDL